MDDLQRWRLAGKAACTRYEQLSGDTRESLVALVSRIMRHKEELLELALAAGSAAICRTCGGACCLNGKYHVSVLDFLVYRITRSDVIEPEFGRTPYCPYGGIGGCRMPPRFRPLTCVIFNCDAVEEMMGDDNKKRFAVAEQELRAAIILVETLLGFRAGRSLLLSCDEYIW